MERRTQRPLEVSTSREHLSNCHSGEETPLREEAEVETWQVQSPLLYSPGLQQTEQKPCAGLVRLCLHNWFLGQGEGGRGGRAFVPAKSASPLCPFLSFGCVLGGGEVFVFMSLCIPGYICV